jgi:very-short-patch-repair endonuclease
MQKIIPYRPHLKTLARELRKNMTRGEVILWQYLKGKKVLGYNFDRQRPIDELIVDFYCKDLMLAIEIDGASHDNNNAQIKDEIRQKQLESFGVQFLRFAESDACNHPEVIIEAIKQWITRHHLVDAP